MEQQGSRARVNIRASGLQAETVRALLLAGSDAVMDLGLVQQGALCWEGPCLRGGYHTLVLATDWPQAQLLLWGYLRPCTGRTPRSLQQVIASYLRYPAQGSAPAPLELPEYKPNRSVLVLRHP